jgi:probable HAF family extracellular repeat protein
MSRPHLQVQLLRLGAALVAGWGAGCGGGDPGTDPPDAPVLGVSAVSPTTSSRDVTLDVRVQGSGFESGTRAVLARNGDTAYATTKVRSNSTTFQSASELVLNLTIEPQAALGRYDVLVLNPGGSHASQSAAFELILSIEAIDLGAGDSSTASGVNNLGHIVGTRRVGGIDRAFLWKNGAVQDLGVLPGMSYSLASRINDNGLVVGGSGTGDIETTSTQGAFVWSASGGMQALATLGGNIAFAQGINELGDIVGMSTTAGDKSRHAVVWRNGVITDLQPASLPSVSVGFDINEAGQVVGRYDARAFVWSPARGMEPLEAATGNGALDNALGIDPGGRIVGWRRATGGSGLMAFLWTAGTFQDLGSAQGLQGIANAINANGMVVGEIRGAQPGAFVWTAADGLNSLGAFQGMKSAVATDVNDIGWIVGFEEGATGGTHAMLWKVK